MQKNVSTLEKRGDEMKFVQPIRDTEKISEIIEKLKARNKRDYMMFITGIYSGLRITKMLELKVKDVKNSDYVTVSEQRKGKASKKPKLVRRILINNALKREFKNYIQNMKDEDYLFKSRNGKNKPICRTQAYLILKEVALECGLNNIGSHSMRKTFGYHTYERTKDLAALMRTFGHTEQSVTLRYIGRDQDEMDKIFRNLSYD